MQRRREIPGLDAYWLSVGDLMAGVVAVVATMFVIVAILPRLSARGKIRTVTDKVRTVVIEEGLEGAIEVRNDRLICKDATFKAGSDRLAPEFQEIVDQVGQVLTKALGDNQNVRILVEGHADSRPVGRKSRFKDNYELSFFRAVAMKQALFSVVPDELRGRVSVVGHGANIPLDPDDPTSAVNRRVEIRLVSQ